jgi:hypothetical protein
MKDWTVAEVASLPACDFCGEQAAFDGQMRGHSAWAFFCECCWPVQGVGTVGLGKGQRLVVVSSLTTAQGQPVH